MPKRSNQLSRIVDRAPDAQTYQQQLKQMFDRLIEEKVQQALADRENAIFQPFYQLRDITDEIRRRQTIAEREKWVRYFEEWGCLHCHEKGANLHAGLGMCQPCHGRIASRLRTIVQANTPSVPHDGQAGFIDTVRLAREALAPALLPETAARPTQKRRASR